MGKVITFGIQKGGAGKSTSAGVVSYLLSEEYKVLAIDLDSQGNLTSLLTQRNIYDFDGETALEALKEQDAKKYVHSISERLDILTSNDLMATFPRFLYTQYRRGKTTLCLHETIKNVRDEYDFIIIDSPPALSEHTINALCTSDEVVICFETSQFCYDALDRFMETYEHAKREVNPNLNVAGILCNIIDVRRSETKYFIEALDTNYPNQRFESMIKRQASTSRLQLKGFENNPELNHAVEPYRPFVKELLERVQHRKQEQTTKRA